MSTKSYTLADGTTATVNATDNGIPFNEGMNVLSKAIKAKIDTNSGGTTSENINVTYSKEIAKHFTYEVISGATIESISDLDCFTIINIDGNIRYDNEIYIKLSVGSTYFKFPIDSTTAFNTYSVHGCVFKIEDYSGEVSFHSDTNYSNNNQYYYFYTRSSPPDCYIKITQYDLSCHDVRIGCLLEVPDMSQPACYHLVILNIELDGE